MSTWRANLIAALALVAAIVVIHPMAEVGMNDDWSYIRTASDLANTGHLKYNGWAAPIIGVQAYWGALFIRLFGFSFSVARASTELLTVLFVPVLVRLFRASGLQTTTALFATLAILLSPLLLISITSFMTDMPAFLLFAGSLLATLEAWKTSDRRGALQWMLLAFALGVLSGSVRQVYWAAAVWFLFVLVVARFRTNPERMATALCIAATLAFSLFVTNWQNAQPYVAGGSMSEAVTTLNPSETLYTGLRYLLRFFINWAVLLLPVSTAFVLFWPRMRPRWIWLPLSGLSGWLVFWLAQPLPWSGNTLTEYGVLMSGLVVPGEKPLVLTKQAVWLIGTAGLLVFGSAALTIIRPRVQFSSETIRFAALTLPFLFVYVAVIAIRCPVYGIFDRYSIPVLAILVPLLLSAYLQKTSRAIPIAAWVLLCIFALYGIATTHDSFSEARARVAATSKLLSSGIKRTQILGGFEFDCWTEVEKTGYTNNGLIKFPAGAFHEADDCSGPDSLELFWRTLTPGVKANYVVALSPLPDLEPQIIVQSAYQTWLPYGTHYAYVQRSNTVLTCQAE